MRSQRFGHILQISSIAGISSNPGLGLYNASKFALEGLTEALALETKHLNIRVTLIEPGAFRTDWAGSSSVRSAKIIPDYDQSAGERISAINGSAVSSPAIL
ncbi:MAG: SDR family NAD(P)-dependent oxidoreductase [Daejeonella sp.]